MGEKTGEGQSGGVNIQGGTVNTGGGDIIGRDKIVDQVGEALRPLTEVISTAPPEKQGEVLTKLEELKKEAAKGEKRDDGVMAKLVEGLVGLVPSAVSAVVSAFSNPILGSIAGPATKSVLEKIQGG